MEDFLEDEVAKGIVAVLARASCTSRDCALKERAGTLLLSPQHGDNAASSAQNLSRDLRRIGGAQFMRDAGLRWSVRHCGSRVYY